MTDPDLYPRMAGDGLMWTVTNVQRGAQGFALLWKADRRQPMQGKALPGVPKLRTRSLGWVLSALHVRHSPHHEQRRYDDWVKISAHAATWETGTRPGASGAPESVQSSIPAAASAAR